MSQHRKYKIGISACFLYPDTNRKVFGPKTLSYLENDMALYVSQLGIIPVLIPDLAEGVLYYLLQEMDGFIFQGGADIAPETYGEQPLFEDKWRGDAYRDQYELRIMDFAVKNDKPILAICRGMQLLNVYFGGTLYQDISTQAPTALQHRDAERYDTLCHKIRFTPGSVMEQLYRDEPSPMVNTVHHQAVKEPGKDLDVLATCPDDGMIEAIGYRKTMPGKVIGVQWHPEFSATLAGRLIDADKLYNHFLSHLKEP